MAIRRPPAGSQHGGELDRACPNKGPLNGNPSRSFGKPDIPTNPKFNKQTYNTQTIKRSTTEPQTSYRRGTNPNMAAYTAYCNTF